MKTFKELYEQGKASRKLLDDLVDEWHESFTEDVSLIDFLGFDNLQEYEDAIKNKRLS